VTAHSNAVGFVHHQEMMEVCRAKPGSLPILPSLDEAGEKTASGRAVSYLEGKLNSIEDAYTMAIVSCALELANSPRKGDAHEMLMKMAKEDEMACTGGKTKKYNR